MSTIPQTLSLSSDVKFCKGVGPEIAKKLAKLNVRTVEELLRLYPRRYEDRRTLPPISQARPGQTVTIKGKLQAFETRTTRGGKVLLRATVGDGTGIIHLTWFNQPWIRQKLERHRGEIIAFGAVKESGWANEISTPEFEILEEDDSPEDFLKIVPVYPSTEGLHQKTIRRAVTAALSSSLAEVEELLPAEFLKQNMLRPIRWSLRQIHAPEAMDSLSQARRRLIFEEFFRQQLQLAMRRRKTKRSPGISFEISKLAGKESPSQSLLSADVVGIASNESLWHEVHRMLTFELTSDQSKVVSEIWNDMESQQPMNRLVQGDVGSGKTVVAACSLLAAVRCGYQGVVMAPTEILAEQHSVGLRAMFEPLGITVSTIVGKQGVRARKKALDAALSGTAQIIVGTHALIEEGVRFDKLGLVVIDEQHRFGVRQRAALRTKGQVEPDVLVMTATPIPRTLSMTLYGDLDISMIKELPPGRSPIKTHWKRAHDRQSVYAGVRRIVSEGRQAYVVCPMIAESDRMQTQAAVDLHYRLSQSEFSELRVGLLHGQMKSTEKEEVMARFRSGNIDVLISTVVIEVGVDVPNATLMVIEDADRFGLSQLHQLRGRVGRGPHQSYCVLIAEAKSKDAAERLAVLQRTSDGFEIAEEDLRLRGAGEALGTKQSGDFGFRIADVFADSKTLMEARVAAQNLVDDTLKLSSEPYRRLVDSVTANVSDLAIIAVS